AKFSRMLQGQRDLSNVGRMVLSELCPVVAAQIADFYVLEGSEEDHQLTLLASYASEGREGMGKRIGLGQGLVGQCAIEKQKILLEDLPSDYIRVSSSLGDAPPRRVLVPPLICDGQVQWAIRLGPFSAFHPT